MNNTPQAGLIRCSFCQQTYIIGQDRVITNAMRSAYICKPCIKKFKAELNTPTPVTPTGKEPA